MFKTLVIFITRALQGSLKIRQHSYTHSYLYFESIYITFGFNRGEIRILTDTLSTVSQNSIPNNYQ